MKTLGNVLKVLAALAAIAGVVFVIIKYGDKIVAWTKETFGKYFPCCCCKEKAEEVVQEVAPVAEEDFEATE